MKRLLVLLCFCAGIALGFVPWQVNGPVRWAWHRLETQSGWQISFAHARWIPWRHLELEDLRLQSRQGGKLHLFHVWIRLSPLSLFAGRLATRWNCDEIRMDPGSWGIRRPLAQELLSTGPVVKGASVVFEADRMGLHLASLTFQGPLLRSQAHGWLTHSRRLHLALDGAFPRRLLEEMDLVKTNEENPFWEPFQVRLHGPLSNLEFSFASKFRSFSSSNMNLLGDKKA